MASLIRSNSLHASLPGVSPVVFIAGRLVASVTDGQNEILNTLGRGCRFS